MERIGIIGAGGQARELAQSINANGKEVGFYAVDSEYVDPADERSIDLTNPTDDEARTAVIVATGATALRSELVERWPGETFATHVDGKAEVATDAELGEGTMIAPFAFVGAGASIGRHCLIGVRATVSHDSEIGDFVTISPSANIAGHVTIGEGSFVGIGSTVSNDIRIAPGTIIGAGAVVVRDIEEHNTTVVGNPARMIRQREEWIREI